jgi:lysophospholipase L1-like esterase
MHPTGNLFVAMAMAFGLITTFVHATELTSLALKWLNSTRNTSMKSTRRIYPMFLFALLVLALGTGGVRAAGSGAAVPAQATEMLQGVHRIVFLGDSITQGGDYVTDFECWLLAHHLQVEVLNLGLASETAADLSPAENSAHLKQFGFGRPFISERLARVLAATKPDLLFACYGMNDGSSLPPDASGTKRFAEAMTRLRETSIQAGVKRVVLCTPPVQDAKGEAREKFHDENLSCYTAWLLSKRADGWDVVDLHTPMRAALDAGRALDPTFEFAKDGVHPGRKGHWLMAREILAQAFGAKLDDVGSAEELFPAHGAEIRKLVHDRMEVLFNSWMAQIGHKRPGVAGAPGAKPGLPLTEAQARAADIAKQIQAQLTGGNLDRGEMIR